VNPILLRQQLKIPIYVDNLRN